MGRAPHHARGRRIWPGARPVPALRQAFPRGNVNVAIGPRRGPNGLLDAGDGHSQIRPALASETGSGCARVHVIIRTPS